MTTPAPVPFVGRLLPGVGQLIIGEYGNRTTDQFLTPVKFPWCAAVWADGAFTVTTSHSTRSYPWAAGRTGSLKVIL